jgi:hypothetical protein
MIINDGYRLRFRDGKFYDDERPVSKQEIAQLNVALEKRRAQTYIEKYGADSLT